MKKIFLLLMPLFLLQSCDLLTLSGKERQISGYWTQNLLVLELKMHFKNDKTLEIYASSGLVKGVIARWGGHWKVMEDRLITTLEEGPEIRTSMTDSDLGAAIKSLGLGSLKVDNSSKIAAVDAEDMILNAEGKETVLKKAKAEEFQALKKSFDGMKQAK